MASLNTKLSGSLIFKDQGTFLSEIRPGPNAVTITGSLNISGSRITLNGSDLGVRIATLESGQGADQVQFGAITLWTASIGEWTGSTDERLYDLEISTAALGEYTSSNDIQTSALFTSASTQDSRVSSLELTSSIDRARISTLEDSELVSSSAQIDALGFLTASIGGIVSSSSQITGLGYITGSKFYDLDDIPSGIVSSSTQIDDLFDIDGLISSSEQIEQLLPFTFKQTGSYGSANTDVQVTGSFNLSLDGVSKYFSIDINGEEKVKVNEEGVFQLISQSSTPTAVEGGMYFGNDFNLYLGVNE